LLWLNARIRQELRSPSNKSAKTVIDFLLRAKKRVPSFAAKVTKDDLLYCIYDLNICDLTYVMGMFLVDCEMQCRQNNKQGFIVVIVPSSLDPILGWNEYDSVIDSHSKLWRFQNIVLPLTFLSPYCRGVNVLPRRSDAIAFAKTHDVYPDLYDGINIRKPDIEDLLYRKLDRPGIFEGLKANTQGLKYVKDWLRAKKIQSLVVTITIRDSAFDTARNSDIEAWLCFARYLVAAGYSPVVIPDTDNAYCEKLDLKGVNLFTECSWNMGLRMALYETSYLNFFVPHGCIVLAMFNPRCSYIAMKQLPKGSIVMNEEAYKKVGHVIGDKYKFANQRQHLCFNDDTYENIRTEFERFVEVNPPDNFINDAVERISQICPKVK
jgi:hypothetical protein